MSRTSELDRDAVPTATVLADPEMGVSDSGEKPDIEEELLIEEISIDGMCGVY